MVNRYLSAYGGEALGEAADGFPVFFDSRRTGVLV